MNGKFDLELTHKLDKETAELLYKAYNATALELTRISIEHNKTPQEVLKTYKQIRDQILE